jgi:hypothetical protein
MSDETTPQDGKAMSPASAGSVADDPVAWAVMPANSDYCITLSTRMQACQQAVRQKVSVGEYASKNDLAVVPLYRSPTLTDAEREAIEWCAAHARLTIGVGRSATLRGLLERLRGGR